MVYVPGAEKHPIFHCGLTWNFIPAQFYWKRWFPMNFLGSTLIGRTGPSRFFNLPCCRGCEVSSQLDLCARVWQLSSPGLCSLQDSCGPDASFQHRLQICYSSTGGKALRVKTSLKIFDPWSAGFKSRFFVMMFGEWLSRLMFSLTHRASSSNSICSDADEKFGPRLVHLAVAVVVHVVALSSVPVNVGSAAKPWFITALHVFFAHYWSRFVCAVTDQPCNDERTHDMFRLC